MRRSIPMPAPAILPTFGASVRPVASPEPLLAEGFGRSAVLQWSHAC